MNKSIFTYGYEETQRLGVNIAGSLKGGEVLALHGDLGSGKTTFVQGLAKGLGIDKRIISPTFIILRTYKTKDEKLNMKNFYHVDLYRIGNEQEAIDLGLVELMAKAENVVVIEWPDKIENLLPENTMHIFFEYVESNKRKIITDR